MEPDRFIANALEPALRLLPAKMTSQPAKAMVIAICLQESRLKHRYQIGGPARGYAQFEKGTAQTRGGVIGVLMHPSSRPHMVTVLTALDYSRVVDNISYENYAFAAADCYIAIEHNDILAAAFARLLLWTLPDALPARGAPEDGWLQYLAAWRPGRPHAATWDAFYEQAWELIA